MGPDATPVPTGPPQLPEAGGFCPHSAMAGCSPQASVAAAAAIGTWLLHVVVRAVYEGGGMLRAADGPLSLKARLLRDAPAAVAEMAAAGGLARFCEANADRLEFVPDPGGGGGVVKLRGIDSGGFFGAVYSNSGASPCYSSVPLASHSTLVGTPASGFANSASLIPTSTTAATAEQQSAPARRNLEQNGHDTVKPLSDHREQKGAGKRDSEYSSGKSHVGAGSQRQRALPGAAVSDCQPITSEMAGSPKVASVLPARIRSKPEREIAHDGNSGMRQGPEAAGTRRSVVCVSTTQPAQQAVGASVPSAARPWTTTEYKALEVEKLRALREMVVRDYGGGGESSQAASSDAFTQRRVATVSGCMPAVNASRGSEEWVAQQLARMVSAAGGELPANRAAFELYRDVPDARETVSEAGGLRGICDRHPALLEFVKDHGAGLVRIPHVPEPAVAPVFAGTAQPNHSDKRRQAAGPKAKPTEQALMNRMVEVLEGMPNEGLLASKVPSLILSSVPGGREALNAAGGLRSFCDNFSTVLEFVAIGGRDTVRLRRSVEVEAKPSDCEAGSVKVVGQDSKQAGKKQTGKPAATEAPKEQSIANSVEVGVRDVVLSLIAMLRRDGSKEMAAQQAAAQLYLEMPAARNIVSAAGGIRRFCLAHAPEVDFIKGSGDHFWLRLVEDSAQPPRAQGSETQPLGTHAEMPLERAGDQPHGARQAAEPPRSPRTDPATRTARAEGRNAVPASFADPPTGAPVPASADGKQLKGRSRYLPTTGAAQRTAATSPAAETTKAPGTPCEAAAAASELGPPPHVPAAQETDSAAPSSDTAKPPPSTATDVQTSIAAEPAAGSQGPPSAPPGEHEEQASAALSATTPPPSAGTGAAVADRLVAMAPGGMASLSTFRA